MPKAQKTPKHPQGKTHTKHPETRRVGGQSDLSDFGSSTWSQALFSLNSIQGNHRLPIVLRQNLATHIGRFQGNQSLQRALNTLEPVQGPHAPIQMNCDQPSTREERETSRATPFRLEQTNVGTPVRHAGLRNWVLYDFAIGSSEFLPEKSGALSSIMDQLAARVADPIIYGSARLYRHLVVTGFSDCRGSNDVNVALRLGRADAFVQEFPRRDRIEGWGGTPLGRYLFDNNTAEERARNRCVLIHEIFRSAPTPLPTEEERRRRRSSAATTLGSSLPQVRRAINALNAPAEIKRRAWGIVSQVIQNPGTNDEYLSERDVERYSRDFVRLRHLDPSTYAHHLRPQILDAFHHSRDNHEFALRLVALDNAIFRGLHRAIQLRATQGDEGPNRGNPPRNASHYLWVWYEARQTRMPNSIYRYYRP